MTSVRAWRLGDAAELAGPALVDVGLACCTLEFEAALASYPDATAVGLTELPAGTPVVAIISGTVTDRLAPAVLAVVEACRVVGPTSVVAFGACACSGGPYWDSSLVTKGIDQLVPVDRYVPGCPPTPDALHRAVAELTGQAAASALGSGLGTGSADE